MELLALSATGLIAQHGEDMFRSMSEEDQWKGFLFFGTLVLVYYAVKWSVRKLISR